MRQNGPELHGLGFVLVPKPGECASAFQETGTPDHNPPSRDGCGIPRRRAIHRRAPERDLADTELHLTAQLPSNVAPYAVLICINRLA